MGPFRLNGVGPLKVALGHQHFDKAPVVLDAGEASADARDQCLLGDFLEMSVLRFHPLFSWASPQLLRLASMT